MTLISEKFENVSKVELTMISNRKNLPFEKTCQWRCYDLTFSRSKEKYSTILREDENH